MRIRCCATRPPHTGGEYQRNEALSQGGGGTTSQFIPLKKGRSGSSISLMRVYVASSPYLRVLLHIIQKGLWHHGCGVDGRLLLLRWRWRWNSISAKKIEVAAHLK